MGRNSRSEAIHASTGVNISINVDMSTSAKPTPLNVCLTPRNQGFTGPWL
jgi:hypothetical protein